VLKRLKGSALARNSLWMLVGQGTSVLLQAVYFVVLARLLGATEYGLLAGATALIAVASQYSSFGAGFIFLRYVSPDLSQFKVYWGYVIAATLLGGCLVVFSLSLIAHWVLRDLSLVAIVCLALGDSLFLQITNSASRVFQTFERMHFSALSSLIVNTLRLCTAIILLRVLHHTTVTHWAVAQMSVSAFGALLAIVVVTSVYGKPQLSLTLLRKHAFEGLLFSSTISTTSIYNDIDKVLLGHYGMNAANGIYAMAYKAIDSPFMIVRSIHSAAFPRFCREGAIGITATRSFARRLLSKTVLVSLAISACLFFGAPLIPVFAGKAFTESVFALRFLCLIPVFRAFHLSAGDALSGAGFQRYRFLYELGAAIGNFGVNLWLIPLYSWKGAAMSSLATDGSLALVSWLTVNALATRARKRQPVSSLA
jgi:O-antigen/teichoic acid export membrane protein